MTDLHDAPERSDRSGPAAPADRPAPDSTRGLPGGPAVPAVPDAKGPPSPRPRHRRRSPLPGLPVLLGAGLGLLAGLGYGLTATPQYEATGYVMVVPRVGTDPTTTLGFAQAYGRIATGSAVLAGARAAAHTPVAVLNHHVRAATSPDAPMISVTGTATRPRTAAAIANAVARSLAATGDRDSAGTGVQLLVFSPAAAPTAPSSPSAPLSACVGAGAGGLLGALLLLVRRKDGAPPTAAAVPAPAEPAPEPARSTL